MRSFVLLVLLVGVALADDELLGQGDADMGCGPHEKHSQCDANPTCQRTCANKEQEAIPCPRTRICIRGCVCKDGYVRTEIYGPCIPERFCGRARH